MIKGVIFDADGTLLNSMGFWENVVCDLIESLGADPEEGLTRILTPMSMSEGAEYIKRVYNLDITVDEIVERENKIVFDFYSAAVTMKDGAMELLDFLKSKNIPMAIASATDRYLIESALRHLNISDYFERVYSCSEVGEGKTSPKIYLVACSFIGTKPDETLVAEDSLQALTTAKKAGFRTLAMYDKTQSGGWEELKKISDLSLDSGFDLNIIRDKFF